MWFLNLQPLRIGYHTTILTPAWAPAPTEILRVRVGHAVMFHTIPLVTSLLRRAIFGQLNFQNTRIEIR